MLRILLIAACALCVYADNEAIVVLEQSDTVKGTIKFSEANGVVTLEGEIRGLKEGKHGFHVHSKGDLSNGCTSTGSHFNPKNVVHGGPDAKVRHVGDLGNIVADSTGVAKINITDKIISLTGPNGILGRAIVVHEGEDDLGLGGHELSNTTGNAGGRLACGIVGILSDDFNFGGVSGFPAPSFAMIISLLITSLFLRKMW